jgi:hypothetical protein
MRISAPMRDCLRFANSCRSSRIFADDCAALLPGHSVAIAIGTTTHLLLAGPVKLPLLGGGMPLLESVCL